MKTIILSRLLTAALVLFVSTSYSQSTETMGTSTGTVSISAHAAAGGFDIKTVTYSGTADVRPTLPSTGYPGASGGCNALIQAQETFVISDIDASTCTSTDIISFGVSKSTNASNGIDYLVLEYSIDNGSSWTSIPYTALPTGSGTAIWYQRSVFMPAAACVSNLIIRFRSTLVGTSSANPQFRIDDIQFCGN